MRVFLGQLVDDLLESGAPLHEVFELVKGGAGRRQDDHVAGPRGLVGGQHRLGKVVDNMDGQRVRAVIRGGFHRGFDLLGGVAGKEQLLYMGCHLGAQHVEGDVLVVAAGDEDHLLVEGAQTGDGT